MDEAVQELKETEFKDLFKNELLKGVNDIVVQDCVIETDLEILIPEQYVTNISERLSLYSKLDSIKEESELKSFIKNVTDRFGPIPSAVNDLIKTVRLRWQAERLGFEKVMLKNELMKCYFVPSDNEKYFQSSIFSNVIKYVQANPRKCQMREYKKRLILTIEEVSTVDMAIELLSLMS